MPLLTSVVGRKRLRDRSALPACQQADVLLQGSQIISAARFSPLKHAESRGGSVQPAPMLQTTVKRDSSQETPDCGEISIRERRRCAQGNDHANPSRFGKHRSGQPAQALSIITRDPTLRPFSATVSRRLPLQKQHAGAPRLLVFLLAALPLPGGRRLRQADIGTKTTDDGAARIRRFCFQIRNRPQPGTGIGQAPGRVLPGSPFLFLHSWRGVFPETAESITPCPTAPPARKRIRPWSRSSGADVQMTTRGCTICLPNIKRDRCCFWTGRMTVSWPACSQAGREARSFSTGEQDWERTGPTLCRLIVRPSLSDAIWTDH